MEEQMMKALFAQQRAQIIFMKAQQPDLIPDSYAHAWLNGLYPFFHDGDHSVPDRPHENFGDYFLVSAEFGLKVIKYLDKLWMAGNSPTFYELEDAFGGRDVRSELLSVCRYCYLDNRFNDDLWNALLTPMECPSEAGWITDKLAENELYL